MGRPSKQRSAIGSKTPITRMLEKRKPISGSWIPSPIKQLARDQANLLEDAFPVVDNVGFSSTGGNKVAQFSWAYPSLSQEHANEFGLGDDPSPLGIMAPPSSPADSTDNEMELAQSDVREARPWIIEELKEGKPKSEQDDVWRANWLANPMVDVEIVTEGLSHLLSSLHSPQQGIPADKLRRMLNDLPADCVPTALDSGELQDAQLTDPHILETALAHGEHCYEVSDNIEMAGMIGKALKPSCSKDDYERLK